MAIPIIILFSYGHPYYHPLLIWPSLLSGQISEKRVIIGMAILEEGDNRVGHMRRG
jgi:hypothetical protein